jgi:hypothetical protein
MLGMILREHDGKNKNNKKLQEVWCMVSKILLLSTHHST